MRRGRVDCRKKSTHSTCSLQHEENVFTRRTFPPVLLSGVTCNLTFRDELSCVSDTREQRNNITYSYCPDRHGLADTPVGHQAARNSAVGLFVMWPSRISIRWLKVN